MSLSDDNTLGTFVELIEINTLSEFKEYIKKNSIILKNFKDIKGERVDILIKCIENNSPLEIIEFVIINGQYESLNYEIYNKRICLFRTYRIDHYNAKNREDTPLACALRNNNFEVADLLIKYGADINFISSEIMGQIVNPKNSWYILEKNYSMTDGLVREVIWSKSWFIKQYYRYKIYDNSFILKLLAFNRDMIPISKYQLEDMIYQEKKKVSYESTLYYWPFKNDHYDILKVFYDNDYRSKIDINNNIYTFLKNYYTEEKTVSFIDRIKKGEIDIDFDSSFIQQLENLITDRYYFKKKKIENLIESNDSSQFIQFVKKNNINLNDFNRKYDKYDDMLRLAIKNNNSIESIKFILKECSYDNFSYDVFSINSTEIIPLLYFTLSLSQYKTFNLLIEKGADIYYGNVMNHIIKKDLIQPQHIKYIIGYDIELTANIFDKIIIENRMDLLKLIIKYYPYNNFFILKLLKFYKNRNSLSTQELNKMIDKEKEKLNNVCKNFYKSAKYNDNLFAISTIYENDTRDINYILKELFQLFSYEISWNDSVLKKKFIVMVKRKKINFPVDKFYLNNLFYSEEKRDTLSKYVKTNNLIELKNYISKQGIILEYFNHYFFDILIYAIENLNETPESMEMIKFILQQYHSLNYSICEILTGKYTSPLSCSIINNKFLIAKLLIERGALINDDIHDTDLLSKIYNAGKLTSINLNFILNRDFNRITIDLISEWITKQENEFLKIVLRHYLFNRSFIINLLILSKHQTALSHQQLENMIQLHQSILTLHDDWFCKALINKNDESLKVLFNYYGDDQNFYNEELFNLQQLIHKASEMNNRLFFELLLTRKTFSFKIIKFEKILEIIVQYNHFELVQYLIEKAFDHDTFNSNNIDIKQTIMILRRVNHEEIIDLFIDNLLLKDCEFILNYFKFKDLLLIITKLNSNDDKLTKSRIDRILNNEKFNFNGDISIKRALLIASEISDLCIKEYYIKVLFSLPLLEFNIFSIENILLTMTKLKIKNSDYISLIQFTIDNMISNEKFPKDIYIYNSEQINFNKILVSSIRNNNNYMINYLSNKLYEYDSNNNFSNLNSFEKILLISSKVDHPMAMKFFIEKLFHIPSLDTINHFNTMNISNVNNNIDQNNNNNNNSNGVPMESLMTNQNFSFILSIIQKMDSQNISLILNILIKLNQIELVKYLVDCEELKSNININCKDKNNDYPIHVTYHTLKSNNKNYEILEYFLDHGINCQVKDCNNKSLFLLAIEDKNYIVINELFKRNIKIEFNIEFINKSPLMMAIYNNQIDLVKSYVKPNDKSILRKIKRIKVIFNNNNSNNNTINKNTNNHNNNNNNNNIINGNNNKNDYNTNNISLNYYFTPLIFSYLLNRLEIFEYLLNTEELNELDYNGYNILHFALLREDINTIKKLIKLGININYYNKYLFYPSAIDIAFHLKNREITVNLLMKNKNLEKSSLETLNEKGEIPLLTLLRLNNYEKEDELEIIKNIFLKDGDINFNSSDKYGNLALDYAIKRNSLSMIKFLVNHGALLEQSLNKNKKQLLNFAVEQCDLEIIKFFVTYDINFFSNDIIKEIIQNNRIDIFQMLIPYYIDIDRKDEDGYSFLNYAIENNNQEIINYLS